MWCHSSFNLNQRLFSRENYQSHVNTGIVMGHICLLFCRVIRYFRITPDSQHTLPATCKESNILMVEIEGQIVHTWRNGCVEKKLHWRNDFQLPNARGFKVGARFVYCMRGLKYVICTFIENASKRHLHYLHLCYHLPWSLAPYPKLKDDQPRNLPFIFAAVRKSISFSRQGNYKRKKEKDRIISWENMKHGQVDIMRKLLKLTASIWAEECTYKSKEWHFNECQFCMGWFWFWLVSKLPVGQSKSITSQHHWKLWTYKQKRFSPNRDAQPLKFSVQWRPGKSRRLSATWELISGGNGWSNPLFDKSSKPLMSCCKRVAWKMACSRTRGSSGGFCRRVSKVCR